MYHNDEAEIDLRQIPIDSDSGSRWAEAFSRHLVSACANLTHTPHASATKYSRFLIGSVINQIMLDTSGVTFNTVCNHLATVQLYVPDSTADEPDLYDLLQAFVANPCKDNLLILSTRFAQSLPIPAYIELATKTRL